MSDLTDKDKDIITEMVEGRKSTTQLLEERGVLIQTPTVNLESETKVKETTTAPQPKVAEVKVRTENEVYKRLRQKFALDRVESHTKTINEMTFSISPLSSRWTAWADSLALTSVMMLDGTYSIPEYQARLEVYLAGTAVTHIDGVSIDEVFDVGGKNTKLSKAKFIDFLFDESSDGLGQQLWLAYDEAFGNGAIAEANLGNELNYKAYKCPKCNNVESYIDEGNPYYCHKDRTQLEVLEVDNKFPLKR